MKSKNVTALGAILERLGHRISTLGYIFKNPGYAKARRNDAARDLYRLLNKRWLRAETIGTVLDVGANEGQFVKIARILFPQASLLAFEPNPRAIDQLQAVPLKEKDAIFKIACGREAATQPLHLATFGPATSLLHPTSLRIPDFPVLESNESIDVNVERLDRILSKNAAVPKPYLLKIDVQGFELEVLHGASGILPDVSVVLCEINLVRFYEGQSSFEEIYAFMRQHGFRLVDIGEPIRAPATDEILYLDVAFLNDHLNDKPIVSA